MSQTPINTHTQKDRGKTISFISPVTRTSEYVRIENKHEVKWYTDNLQKMGIPYDLIDN